MSPTKTDNLILVPYIKFGDFCHDWVTGKNLFGNLPNYCQSGTWSKISPWKHISYMNESCVFWIDGKKMKPTWYLRFRRCWSWKFD